MIQFQAKTLEEAYELATSEFRCSITDLEVEIIQSSTNGFFGFFAKEAIISASKKTIVESQSKQIKPSKEKQKNIKKEVVIPKKKEKIFNDFYSNNNNDDDEQQVHNNITIKNDDKILNDINEKINELFSHTCYILDEINVSFYNDETVYIEFKGKDAALLIGKEGYRYKALSYILFNWIHEKYNLMLRLEVAQFLSTQEESIYNYLIPVIETIKNEGYFKTKPLDGVLVHIALKKLREEFPDKYVAVKTNIKGDKYILVNEYRK